jgi:N-acetylmuramoyl-L-alanine amidase
MSRKIFLSAGHGGTDSGAVGNGFIERDLTIDLRNHIARELKALGIVPSIDSDRNALSQTLAWLRGKFKSKDILLDLHWNASSNPEAKGSEVIIPDIASQFEKDLAKDRGVKPEALTARKKLGWMRPVAENVLIEVCFISNITDMKLYEANKNNIAKKIASTLNHYSKLP